MDMFITTFNSVIEFMFLVLGVVCGVALPLLIILTPVFLIVCFRNYVIRFKDTEKSRDYFQKECVNEKDNYYSLKSRLNGEIEKLKATVSLLEEENKKRRRRK